MSSLLAESSEFAMTGWGGGMKAMIRSELSHCRAAGLEWLVGWLKLGAGGREGIDKFYKGYTNVFLLLLFEYFISNHFYLLRLGFELGWEGK
mgnify:CR=1 FL=1